jgi:hypothetical protein
VRRVYDAREDIAKDMAIGCDSKAIAAVDVKGGVASDVSIVEWQAMIISRTPT